MCCLHLCDLNLQGRQLSLMIRNPTVGRLDLGFQILDSTDKVGRRSTCSCSYLALQVESRLCNIRLVCDRTNHSPEEERCIAASQWKFRAVILISAADIGLVCATGSFSSASRAPCLRMSRVPSFASSPRPCSPWNGCSRLPTEWMRGRSRWGQRLRLNAPY